MTLLASRNAHPADFTRIIGLIEKGAIDTRRGSPIAPALTK